MQDWILVKSTVCRLLPSLLEGAAHLGALIADWFINARRRSPPQATRHRYIGPGGARALKASLVSASQEENLPAQPRSPSPAVEAKPLSALESLRQQMTANRQQATTKEVVTYACSTSSGEETPHSPCRSETFASEPPSPTTPIRSPAAEAPAASSYSSPTYSSPTCSNGYDDPHQYWQYPSAEQHRLSPGRGFSSPGSSMQSVYGMDMRSYYYAAPMSPQSWSSANEYV